MCYINVSTLVLWNILLPSQRMRQIYRNDMESSHWHWERVCAMVEWLKVLVGQIYFNVFKKYESEITTHTHTQKKPIKCYKKKKKSAWLSLPRFSSVLHVLYNLGIFLSSLSISFFICKMTMVVTTSKSCEDWRGSWHSTSLHSIFNKDLLLLFSENVCSKNCIPSFQFCFQIFFFMQRCMSTLKYSGCVGKATINNCYLGCMRLEKWGKDLHCFFKS